MKRRICYISGTRADFGLMERTLARVKQSSTLDLAVCVTGMHLSYAYGETVREIENAGFRISGRVPVDVETTNGAAMARALGRQLIGFVDIFLLEHPDVVIVVGDRGEMLAGALAALHLNIPIVHIHGGERSGTIDEPVRHAISKLSHYHFVATNASRARLIYMGEQPTSIFVTGAPGLDALEDFERHPRDTLARTFDLEPCKPIALVIYHPVVQTATSAASEMEAVLTGVLATGVQVLCFCPNSDAGGSEISRVINTYAACGTVHSVTHLPRDLYLSWLAEADVLVGNSSSGVIEAASFGLPVVNIGDRQHGRERNTNIRDVILTPIAIQAAINDALAGGRYPPANIYGDGHAGERIVELLSTLPLEPSLLLKSNAY